MSGRSILSPFLPSRSLLIGSTRSATRVLPTSRFLSFWSRSISTIAISSW